MDLDTENRLASLLMEEARRLRVEADKEGVHVYLHPKVRARPNSRFLSATVLGVQQANKAVEIDEMWRAREKELELDNRLKGKSRESTRDGHRKHREEGLKGLTKENSKTNKKPTSLLVSGECEFEDRYSIDDNGLRDEDIEKFLHSRAKRGKGTVGSRMDEPGPYPTCGPSYQETDTLTCSEVRVEEMWERRALGPEKPLELPSNKLDLKEDVYDVKLSKRKEASSSKKRKSDDKRRSKEEKRRKKKRKERRSRYRGSP